jgi:hypothetical protein
MIDECQCPECLAAKAAELTYAIRLDRHAIEAKRMLDQGDDAAAFAVIDAAAAIAYARDPEGELNAVREARRLKEASAARTVGRLH